VHYRLNSVIYWHNLKKVDMACPSYISYNDMKVNFLWNFNGSALKPKH